MNYSKVHSTSKVPLYYHSQHTDESTLKTKPLEANLLRKCYH